MKVIAKAKWIRISDRKMRRVIKLLRGKPVQLVLDSLKFMPQKAALLLGKVVKSAMSNAVNNYKLAQDKLIISEAYVDGAAAWKRFRAVSRGRAHPIKKRTSHITVIVEEKV